MQAEESERRDRQGGMPLSCFLSSLSSLVVCPHTLLVWRRGKRKQRSNTTLRILTGRAGGRWWCGRNGGVGETQNFCIRPYRDRSFSICAHFLQAFCCMASLPTPHMWNHIMLASHKKRQAFCTRLLDAMRLPKWRKDLPLQPKDPSCCSRKTTGSSHQEVRCCSELSQTAIHKQKPLSEGALRDSYSAFAERCAPRQQIITKINPWLWLRVVCVVLKGFSDPKIIEKENVFQKLPAKFVSFAQIIVRRLL